jgi:hypothetical protein
MMKNITKLNILSSFPILAVLAFGLMLIPAHSYAGNCGEGGCNYVYSIHSNPAPVEEINPAPVMNSISPNSSNVGVGTKTVTITGEGFTSNSIARVNGSNRPTTFIDSTHIMTQVTGNDMYNYRSNGGFFITVFNSAPGGGSSNATFFTVNKTVTPASTVNTNTGNSVNDTSTNFTDAPESPNGSVQGATDENGNNLAANPLFGSRTFTPSGLIQWIFLAILVLIAVILVRRAYGADKRYHATPLKHS